MGCIVTGNRANFAFFSEHASQMTLGLKKDGQIQEIPLNRTENVWHTELEGWSEKMEYAIKIDSDHWLADPYSKSPATSRIWGEGIKTVWSYIEIPKSFDWQETGKPCIPLSELIIYEMHVRAFTIHSSSGVAHRGTYSGIIEKIPYLKKLGVNAIELMPIFEFDETRLDLKEKKGLLNFWGYDPLYFFSPMRRYASKEDAKTEFKTLVRELHKHGIEVILDVVYNHTGEWDTRAFQFSFRPLDDPIYYMVDEQGHYRNYTGCGHTFNVNHPVVLKLILASLRFWAEEMQVDGFRFDLASVFTRDPHGNVMKNPPVLEAIAKDPLLQNLKLISESWDASGLYQVGRFPHFGPWSEWNGKYRDRVREFIKGTDGCAGMFAEAISGSEFLYHSFSPSCSINFITAHDGFSLKDLVSYNHKHNEANGHLNQDGVNRNLSWNCGHEGPSNNPDIQKLRERQMRNFLLALFLSQGVPMLLMADEYGHSRQGNNNPYVQDNEVNWFLWDQVKTNGPLVDFVSFLIHFRKTHPELRKTRFLNNQDIDWHGLKPFQPDWSPQSRFVACSYKSSPRIYFAFNADFKPQEIWLPEGKWKEILRTDKEENCLNHPQMCEKCELDAPFLLSPYSAILATVSQGLG